MLQVGDSLKMKPLDTFVSNNRQLIKLIEWKDEPLFVHTLKDYNVHVTRLYRTQGGK